MKSKIVSLSLFAMLAAFAVGCGGAPALKAEPVEVAGSVVMGGKPLGNVSILFLPTTATQTQVTISLKADGKFETKLIPGKYGYVFEGSSPAFNTIPQKYTTNQADRTIEIPATGNKSLTITLEK
ncbi:MAG: hypothetical protein ACRC8S_06025 [Fimbriiglobus sp.]